MPMLLDGQKCLTLNLKKKYFEEIKIGKKKEEYREFKEYWTKRLTSKEYDIIAIKLGYPPKNSGSDKVLYFKWNGYTEKEIKHEIFDNEKIKVYAIDLSKPLTNI